MNNKIKELLDEARQTYRDEDIKPICIPSYNRPNCTSIDLVCSNYHGKVYLFIYPEQIELYKHFTDKYDCLEIIPCVGFKGIIDKRNFVINTMNKMGHEYFYFLDDDILTLDIPDRRKSSGKCYRNYLKQISSSDFFKLWQLGIEKYNTNKNWLICGPNQKANSWSYDLDEVNKYITSLSFTYSCFALNCKNAVNKNIYYRKNVGWDDLDFFLQGIINGLDSFKIIFIIMEAASMKETKSVANNSVGKHYQNNILTYNTWGSDLLELKYLNSPLISSNFFTKLIKKNAKSILNGNRKFVLRYEQRYLDAIKNDTLLDLLKEEKYGKDKEK